MIRINYYKISQWLFVLFIGFTFVGLTPFAGERLEYELSDTGHGNFLRQLIFLSLWFMSALCFRRLGDINVLYKLKSFILLLIWCVVSFFWAEEPLISIRRSALLILTASTLLMLVSILDKDDLIDLLSKLFLFLLFISLIAIPIVPGAVHISSDFLDSTVVGNWKGIFPHKNQAGPAMVFSAFIFIFKYQITNDKKWLLFTFLSVFFIYFTHSKTSLILLFPSIAFSYAVCFWTKTKMRDVILWSGIFLIFAFLMSSRFLFDEFEHIIENPEAFTGRAAIWDLMLQAIEDNFWLGLGYGSVWFVGDSMLLTDYAFGWVDWGFIMTQGHNGYLDTALSIGVIGLLMTLWVMFINPTYMIISEVKEKKHLPLLLMFLFFFVFHNIFETDLFNASKGRWIIFLTMFYFCTLKLSNSDKDVE